VQSAKPKHNKVQQKSLMFLQPALLDFKGAKKLGFGCGGGSSTGIVIRSILTSRAYAYRAHYRS
jgi:hypothetical protein